MIYLSFKLRKTWHLFDNEIMCNNHRIILYFFKYIFKYIIIISSCVCIEKRMYVNNINKIYMYTHT